MMGMPTCRELTELYASGRYDELGPFRRLAARAHLLICRYCRDFIAQLDAISRAARETSRRRLSSAGLEDLKRRLIERLAGGPT